MSFTSLIARSAFHTRVLMLRVFIGIIAIVSVMPVMMVAVPTASAQTDITCTLTADVTVVERGASVRLTWSAAGYDTVTLNGVAVPATGEQVVSNILVDTTFTLNASAAGGAATCSSSVDIICLSIPPATCTLTPITQTITLGQSVTLAWTTTNATAVTLTSLGSVATSSGSVVVTPTTAGTTVYTLSVTGRDGGSVDCTSTITITPPATPVPTCAFFTAVPATIVSGASSTLSWSVSNAGLVVINNGIGNVATTTGTYLVSPLVTTTYRLTAFANPEGTGTSVSCEATVTITPLPGGDAPTCDSFTVSPASLPVGGGSTTLSWTTRNGVSASISPIVGVAALSGSTSVTIASTTTFTLALTGTGGRTASCPVTVSVATGPGGTPFTCGTAVAFTANPDRIREGASSELRWTTTGVDTVRFEGGITATSTSGTVVVAPSTTSTYTLLATRGASTISCPVTLTVETDGGGGGGGGGGGSSSPTCELAVSETEISRGDSIFLRWNTSRATGLTLRDSHGRVLAETDGVFDSSERRELFDGERRLAPTTDTTYTLTVTRGSRERVCTARVTLDDVIAFTEARDQLPLAIALADVPYTGFEAGPFLTFSFYVLLFAWSLYLTYVIVMRKVYVPSFVTRQEHIIADRPTPEEIRPDVFVTRSVPAMVAPVVSEHTPVNLPVATEPVIGYASLVEASEQGEYETPVASATDEIVTELENYAHAKKALLSGDAIRYFMSSTASHDERIAALSTVIASARERYPLEDGWLVINEERMRSLCLTCIAVPPSNEAPYIPTVIPEGSGSLAEAIVTGNIVAAYEMIGHRPMFALADAAADLDSVYRHRRGAEMVISDLLLQVTAEISDEQLLSMIKALTGALDGVYTDEASAVKMAIMKAVKVIA